MTNYKLIIASKSLQTKTNSMYLYYSKERTIEDSSNKMRVFKTTLKLQPRYLLSYTALILLLLNNMEISVLGEDVQEDAILFLRIKTNLNLQVTNSRVLT